MITRKINLISGKIIKIFLMDPKTKNKIRRLYNAFKIGAEKYKIMLNYYNKDRTIDLTMIESVDLKTKL